jgi:hypothetical protein
VDDLIKIRQLKPKSSLNQLEFEEDEEDLNKATGIASDNHFDIHS